MQVGGTSQPSTIVSRLKGGLLAASSTVSLRELREKWGRTVDSRSANVSCRSSSCIKSRAGDANLRDEHACVCGTYVSHPQVCLLYGNDEVPRDVPLAGLDNIVADSLAGKLSGVAMLQARMRTVTGRYCAELGGAGAHRKLQSTLSSSASQSALPAAPAPAPGGGSDTPFSIATNQGSWKVRLPAGEPVTSSAAASLRSCRAEAVELAVKVAAALEAITVSRCSTVLTWHLPLCHESCCRSRLSPISYAYSLSLYFALANLSFRCLSSTVLKDPVLHAGPGHGR